VIAVQLDEVDLAKRGIDEGVDPEQLVAFNEASIAWAFRV
jgi:hypothetical protein